MSLFNAIEYKPFHDALAFGLEAQDAIYHYLSRQEDARVWKADEVEGRGVYRDSQGLPIPDLLKMEKGKGCTLVEVKAREEWWQEGGYRGRLETIVEVEHIRNYAWVAEKYATPLVMVMVMRPVPGVKTSRGYRPRGPAGCWWAYIQDLIPLIETGPIRSLYKRPHGHVPARGLLRIQDGGPLRPLCPWDEVTKSVPQDPAACAVWRAREEAASEARGPAQIGLPFG